MANRRTKGRSESIGNAVAAPGTALAKAVRFPEPIDGADFLAENIPPPDWIIPDFFAKHYQGALFGKSKSRKSFFAIQLGLSVACGVKFLGFPAPSRPRRVAYFNLELMPRFLQERLRAQTDALGVIPERGFFKVYNLRGSAGELRRVFTDDDDHIIRDNDLTRQLRNFGIDLAIIDPRYKLMQGEEDENSAAGLRALLDFRTMLADECGVLLIGHDPKGDVSGKSLLDRGAGSYTAMADDDCTVILSPNGYADNAVTVETIHRNRAPVVPFAALFDGSTQSFSYDPHIPVENSGLKSVQSMTQVERAKKNAEVQAAFERAALDVADEAGENLLGKKAFRGRVTQKPGAAVGYHQADDFLGALIESGTLATASEMEVGPDGTAKVRYHGKTFVSTPDRIAAYKQRFQHSLTEFPPTPPKGGGVGKV